MSALATDGRDDPAGPLAASIRRVKAAATAQVASPTAQLVVQAAGEDPQVYPLTGDVIRLGRAEDNDIVLRSPFISRHQAVLHRSPGGYRVEPQPDATTPIVHLGRTVTAPWDLTPGDFFRLPGDQPGDLVSCIYIAPAIPLSPAEGTLSPTEGATVRIGSAPDNDLGVENPLLAPNHAQLTRSGGCLVLLDLGAGETLVNDAPIHDAISLTPGDSVRIGSLRLRVTPAGVRYRDPSAGLLPGARRPRLLPEDLLRRMAGTGGVQLDALHLGKRLKKGVNLLQDISLHIRPREFVVLVGLSGAGKSTLLDALAGYRPATSGRVLVNGVDLYDRFESFRTRIGYVPQKDIVHMGLTVFEALDYAAQLRMPPKTTAAARHQRVAEVMADLGLTERRDVPVKSLSGGQIKRVSIGVELITRPSLFFLDEPTSGLDPGTETGLMQLLRDLADQGRTIVMITHATRNVMLADKVIFLVRGGRVAWYGPPGEALAYFHRYRSERERHDKAMEFDAIYTLLEDPAKGSPEEWERRYKATAAYQQHIADPLQLGGAARNGDVPQAEGETSTPARPPRVPPLRQLIVLSRRNLTLLARDRFALALMLLAAPALALMDFLITQRHMYDPIRGDAARIVSNTNTIIVNAMLVGALAQMREIIKDKEIYRRERLVSLRIVPYMLSKVWVAVLLAAYQAAVWVLIRYLAVDMPGGWGDALGIYITMVLVTYCGMMLGLFASAIAPSEDSVALIVALLIVPQVLFSGAHLPMHKLQPLVRSQMVVMPSRWAFEALLTQGGHGKALARDGCWKRSEADRAALTDEQKQSCICLGPNIFTACTFPGIRAYDTSARFGGTGPPSDRAVATAEGRLTADYDYYGPIYDVNVVTRWLALLGIGLGLVGIIIAIQKLKERR